MLGDKDLELVCLGCPAILTFYSRREVEAELAGLVEYIELASRLACPLVSIRAGVVETWDYDRAARSRLGYTLREIAPLALNNGVTIVVENSGDFPASNDLWFTIDAVDHPAVRACWNQRNALIIGERPTRAVPRLGGKVGLVHLCDAGFDDRRMGPTYATMGQGDCEVVTQIELLKGLTYEGYLMYDWPQQWMGTSPDPETALADAVKFIRKCLESEPVVLTAYKGDKYVPKLAPRNAVALGA